MSVCLFKMVLRWVQGDVDDSRGSDSSDRCRLCELESVVARSSCYINQLERPPPISHSKMQHRTVSRAGPSWKFACPPGRSGDHHARNTHTQGTTETECVHPGLGMSTRLPYVPRIACSHTHLVCHDSLGHHLHVNPTTPTTSHR